jgi:hypothetical protein
MLLGIIEIMAWGVGFIPRSAWGAWHWTLESNKCNQTKEMDVISKYHDLEIIHEQYI